MCISNQCDILEIFKRFQMRNPNPKTELIYYNAYTFCLAVLLSAQTTDKAVNKATEELFKISNTPSKMINLGIDALKNHIKTLGLFNNKAKNIILLSEKLIKEYDSEIPNSRDLLETLPGIGRKSANVIMSELFDAEYIAVDTHVLRVSNRIGLTKSTTPLDVEKDLSEIVPKEFHKNTSNWLVLHGRYICTARNPKCHECFLNDLCKYFFQCCG
ncbi:MAG: endonuclease III [Clostridia bacterium]|nr:endonuclease III [Clostridia bacterium]